MRKILNYHFLHKLKFHTFPHFFWQNEKVREILKSHLSLLSHVDFSPMCTMVSRKLKRNLCYLKNESIWETNSNETKSIFSPFFHFFSFPHGLGTQHSLTFRQFRSEKERAKKSASTSACILYPTTTMTKQCLKITEKVSFSSYVYILRGQKLIKMPNWSICRVFWEP